MFGYALADVPGQIAHYMQELWQAFFVLAWARHFTGMAVVETRLAFWHRVAADVCVNAVFSSTTTSWTKRPCFADLSGMGAVAGHRLSGIVDMGKRPNTARKRRSARRNRTQPVWQSRVLIGLMLFTVVLAFAWNLPRVSRVGDTSVRELGESILRHAEPNAVIFWMVGFDSRR